MYAERDIVASDLGESIHKYGCIKIGSTTFGSKLQPRGIRSGQILASWPASNGKVLKQTFCCLLALHSTTFAIHSSWEMIISPTTLLVWDGIYPTRTQIVTVILSKLSKTSFSQEDHVPLCPFKESFADLLLQNLNKMGKRRLLWLPSSEMFICRNQFQFSLNEHQEN